MTVTRRRVRWSGWGVALAGFAVLLAVGLSGKGSPAQRPAPPLPRARLAGPPATLASLRGHAAVVVFWASWCSGCQREAPAVGRFARSAAGRGHVVGIDYEDPDTAEARAFVRRYGWGFPIFSDHGRAGEAYGLKTLPTSYVLNARGRIVATLLGAQSVASLTHALARAG